MRYVKPIKGFRFTRNLGVLLFSTAVISGQFVAGNKAYGVEAPKLPPTFMIASTNNTAQNVNAKDNSVKAETKKEVKKEVKSEKSIDNLPKINNDKEVIKDKAPDKTVAVSKPQTNEVKEKVMPPSFGLPNLPLNNSEEDFSISKSEPKADTKAEVKPEVKSEPKVETKVEVKAEPKVEPKVEAKPANNLIASAKIIDDNDNDNDDDEDIALSVKNPLKIDVKNDDSEKKVVTKAEKKEVVKEEIKVKQEPVAEAKVSEPKKATKKVVEPVVKKIEVKDLPKVNDIEQSSDNTKVSKEVVVKPKKTVRRRAVKEENVCPPEWDWFSAPLVFVKDENGKMVIRADKNAPKIVIGNNVSDSNSVNNIKRVEPKPVEAKKKVVAKKATKPQKKAEPVKVVEAKPVEAPATQNITIEPKPVVEENNNTEKVVVERKVTGRPVVRIRDDNNAEKTVKPMFSEAAEKMARIKRLHSFDADNNQISLKSAARSQSMVKMNKLVAELIDKSEKASNKKNEMMAKAELAPQAPPASYKTTAKSANNDSSVSSNNNNRYAFRPYVDYNSGSFRNFNLRTVR